MNDRISGEYNMNHKNQSDKQSLTSLQRQAVLVCVVCALAAVLTGAVYLWLVWGRAL